MKNRYNILLLSCFVVFKSFSQMNFSIPQKAIDGDVKAQFNLGLIYFKGQPRFGIPKNYKRAFYWWKKSAEKGHYKAQYGLYILYVKGLGTLKDLNRANYWKEKALQNIAAYKNYKAAENYKRQRDNKKAILLFYKSAKLGNADAQCSIGIMYYLGEGVLKDLKKAASWWYQAAQKNHARSQYYLGVLYYHGEGVPKNLKQARNWIKKAYLNVDTSFKDKAAQFWESKKLWNY